MARGRKGKEYTEEQLREAISMYSDANIPFSKIHEATGVPQIVLQRYIAQNSIEPVRRKLTRRAGKQVDSDQISELILSGKSLNEISSQLNINVNTVRNHMSEEAWTNYLKTKRRGRTPKALNKSPNISIDDQLIIAQKMYDDTQRSFKEIQDSTGVFLKSLKKYISTLESVKEKSKD